MGLGKLTEAFVGGGGRGGYVWKNQTEWDDQGQNLLRNEMRDTGL